MSVSPERIEEAQLALIRERWANNYCSDCRGACYATTAYEDVRYLLAALREAQDTFKEQLRLGTEDVRRERDEAQAENERLREREKAIRDYLAAHFPDAHAALSPADEAKP